MTIRLDISVGVWAYTRQIEISWLPGTLVSKFPKRLHSIVERSRGGTFFVDGENIVGIYFHEEDLEDVLNSLTPHEDDRKRIAKTVDDLWTQDPGAVVIFSDFAPHVFN